MKRSVATILGVDSSLRFKSVVEIDRLHVWLKSLDVGVLDNSMSIRAAWVIYEPWELDPSAVSD